MTAEPLSNPINMFWACMGLHLIADYFLQGILADLKQKQWWDGQIKKLYEEYEGYNKSFEWQHHFLKMYKYDYMAGLFCHALMWSIVTFFPLMWFCDAYLFFWIVFINWMIHAIIDHGKANIHCFNLVQDQLYHLTQVEVTVFITYILL